MALPAARNFGATTLGKTGPGYMAADPTSSCPANKKLICDPYCNFVNLARLPCRRLQRLDMPWRTSYPHALP
ncbi:hypothetical protein CBOM_07924 [Ceraceosorus bombacis]|uniref:Uncharacterized protein n=1 Tax=Ceraceosorus bombacis TaxID=401625 RepID=A0A0P1BPH2_9BASI|nr:hypothetical protein CBOM_07924 [Ceraceosorus bombacis]